MKDVAGMLAEKYGATAEEIVRGRCYEIISPEHGAGRGTEKGEGCMSQK